MWVDPVQSVEAPNRTNRRRKGECALSLLELRYPSSPALDASGSRAFRLTLRQQQPPVLRPLDPDGIPAPAFLGPRLADGRWWDFSASITM